MITANNIPKYFLYFVLSHPANTNALGPIQNINIKDKMYLLVTNGAAIATMTYANTPAV